MLRTITSSIIESFVCCTNAPPRQLPAHWSPGSVPVSRVVSIDGAAVLRLRGCEALSKPWCPMRREPDVCCTAYCCCSSIVAALFLKGYLRYFSWLCTLASFYSGMGHYLIVNNFFNYLSYDHTRNSKY